MIPKGTIGLDARLSCQPLHPINNLPVMYIHSYIYIECHFEYNNEYNISNKLRTWYKIQLEFDTDSYDKQISLVFVVHL